MQRAAWSIGLVIELIADAQSLFSAAALRKDRLRGKIPKP
jgi:hypothetical protein